MNVYLIVLNIKLIAYPLVCGSYIANPMSIIAIVIKITISFLIIILLLIFVLKKMILYYLLEKWIVAMYEHNYFASHTVSRDNFPDANTVGELLDKACERFKLDRTRTRFRANFCYQLPLDSTIPEGEHEISQVPINRIRAVELLTDLIESRSDDDARKFLNRLKKIIDPQWMNIHWVENFYEDFISSCEMFANSIDSETVESECLDKIKYYLRILKNTTKII